MEDQNLLAKKIQNLRKEKNLTQREVADKLGVSEQAVSKWETGLCYPDMALIPSIANYFGVSIDELFGYKNDRDRKIDAIIKEIDALVPWHFVLGSCRISAK